MAPPETDLAAKEFKLNPHKALIYIVRPSAITGSGVSIIPRFDNKVCAALKVGTYTMVEATPGTHRIALPGVEKVAYLDIETKAGQLYFVKAQIMSGLLEQKLILERLSDKEGKSLVSACSLAIRSQDERIASSKRSAGQPQLSQPSIWVSPSVEGIAFSPDGNILASAGHTETMKGTIMLWDVATRRPMGPPLAGHSSSVESVAFSPDSKILASGSSDQTIILWDVVTRQPLRPPLVGHKAGVLRVTFSPDGKMLASSDQNGTILLWDVARAQPLEPPLTGGKGQVIVTFSPDGKILASSGMTETMKGAIILWDILTLKPIGSSLTICPYPALMYGLNVLFSPDGKILASTSPDDTIRLWDVATRQPLGPPLAGHIAPLTSVAFSPDSKILASASTDETIILWDMVTHQPLGTPLAGHQADVLSIAFSPDGKTLASGSSDNTVRLWDISLPSLQAGTQKSAVLEMPKSARPSKGEEPEGPASPKVPEPGEKDLEKAIATLRHIDPSKLSQAEQDQKSKDLDKAWNTIRAAGKNGVTRLKKEIEEVEKSGEKDHFFKLNAAAFLWDVGKFDEVDAIVSLWSSAPLTFHYHYVFHTAFAAAATQDPRVLPLLKIILRDYRGVAQTSHMPVRWPDSHEFIWGAYGPKGLPVLMEILKTSKDPVELMSAVHLLADAQYLEALPFIRNLSRNDNVEVRVWPILELGHFGHPQDYAFLISGLQSGNENDISAHITGLGYYGDLRAVPHLIPFLKSNNPSVRADAIYALRVLLTPASLQALRDHEGQAKDTREAQTCKRVVETVLKNMNLTWADYQSKAPEEKEKLIEELRARNLSFQTEERRLSREVFLKAASLWKEHHRLPSWLQAKHLMTAATVEDITLLLDVKGAVLLRLSDECLYETRSIDEAVRYVGRSRYRKDPGVTQKVEER
jgi:WD40 repeat protein